MFGSTYRIDQKDDALRIQFNLTIFITAIEIY